MLTEDDRRMLFSLARAALRAHLQGEPPPDVPRGSAALDQIRGLFVTLRRDGELRGCIGHTIGQRSLAESTRELAVAAGFRDRRFPPLDACELDSVAIELSVLSKLEPADLQRVEIGRHGLVIGHRGRTGLLLPQVAAERAWDRETFLEQTCAKAGLPRDAWREPDAVISWFTCEIYDEHSS